MTKIAFIGLGNMGTPMAGNLVKAGHDVIGFDLVPANLERAGARGVKAAESADAAAEGAEVVITMLPAGKDTIAVYEKTKVLSSAAPGAVFVDCSTIDVKTAKVTMSSSHCPPIGTPVRRKRAIAARSGRHRPVP